VHEPVGPEWFEESLHFINDNGFLSAQFTYDTPLPFLATQGSISMMDEGLTFSVGGGLGGGTAATATGGLTSGTGDGWCLDIAGDIAAGGFGGGTNFGYNLTEGHGYGNFGGGVGYGGGWAATLTYSRTFNWEDVYAFLGF
jgi:hypothetical protein